MRTDAGAPALFAVVLSVGVESARRRETRKGAGQPTKMMAGKGRQGHDSEGRLKCQRTRDARQKRRERAGLQSNSGELH